MKKINKKIIIPLVIILLLSVSVFSMTKTKITNSLIHKTDVKEDLELDNWEISTVFYDSTVNNGATPLTSINWDASNASTGVTEIRVITVQINYKNTNTVTTYSPGELEISIANLTYNSDQVYVTKNFGVNDSNHTGYDWNLISEENDSVLKFSNNVPISANSNLEGTIRLNYTITSKKEVDYVSDKNLEAELEVDADECTHGFTTSLVAKINEQIESNQIDFSYTRTYSHPWNHFQYNLTKTAEKISSYDRLGENPQDYTWVKYVFTFNHIVRTHHRVISFFKYIYPFRFVPSDDFILEDDEIPDGCVVYDFYGNKVEKENGVYTFTNLIDEDNYTAYYYNSKYYAYVGYPKSVYNEENGNNIIHNHVKLKGKYYTESEVLDLAEAESTIDLNDYQFNYTGDLYSFSKHNTSNNVPTIPYEKVVGIDKDLKSLMDFYIDESIMYTGQKYDAVIGDDALFITDKDNELRKLSDDEYHFKRILFQNYFKNTSGQTIDLSNYDSEVWVRYAGEEEYVFFKEIKGSKSENFAFDSNNVVGFYIIVKNLQEGLDLEHLYVSVEVDNADINNTYENTGKIYNFGYLKVFINGELANPGTEENYINGSLSLLGDYDLEEHGSLLQRSSSYNLYEPFQAPIPNNYVSVNKEMPLPSQNEEKKLFEGTANLKLIVGGSGTSTVNCDTYIGKSCVYNYYISKGIDPNSIEGWNIYDLLPTGMKLESSAEEIKNSFVSIWSNRTNELVYSIDEGQYITNGEFARRIKDNLVVTITNNYKGTDRTFIKISMNLHKKYYLFDVISFQKLVTLTYNYSIDYESYIENGSTWTNNAYADYVNHEANTSTYEAGSGKTFIINTPNSPLMDNGSLDQDEIDINNNGKTNEYIGWGKATIDIPSVVSTYQDVQTSVQSEISNFDTGKVNVTKNGEYTYKLRVRTGQNDVTNLVIYDSLEDYAKNSNLEIVKASGGKPSWQGEFLDIDTSYAESKGYQVKVFYNTNPNPGTLTEDNTWQEYNDNTDKAAVKMLAFKYLNENGVAPAVIPANTTTYVLIKMKSPNEDLTSLSYNGCWTEWNAIDSVTEQPVDFVTGINSNIVKVALPSSVEMVDMELTLTKKWVDKSNTLNKRPETVKYYLVANNDYNNSQEVIFGGAGNTWTTTIAVPKYDDNGDEISYEILEDNIDLEGNYKYISSVDGYEVTNTLYKEIIITKNWIDNSNAYLTRPPNITVKVYQNGSYYKDLNITGNYTTNTWTGSLSVPVYDNSGNEYEYTVDEISVDNYSTTCDELVCTNKLTGNTNIVVQKEWVDNNNAYSTRPDSVTIKIKQNGNDYKNVTLTGTGNSWNSETVTVPKYDNNGVKYTYTVIEETVPKYGLVEYDQEHFKVTNTLKETTLLTITKIWKDSDNEYNTRPDSLNITVLQNGNNYQTVTLSGDTDTWTTTLEVPKYDDDQHEYTYSIKEVNDDIQNEYSDITYSQDSLTVTNGLKKDYDLTITKIWDDNSNEYLVRPSSIDVKVLQNGEEYQTITMNGNGNTWTKKITVPYYDEQNKKYEYTIQEDVEVPKYGSVTYDQTTHTITNKLTEIPTVTLYFTVKTAYVDPVTGELKYDEDGFNKVLEKYNVNPDDEYVFTFTLQNLDTHKTYDGKLTTKGILEFTDIPYGKYEAVQGKDELFEFVDMTSLGEVLGVSFERVGNKGIITVKPTGQDIIFGAELLNKIKAPIENPDTKSGILESILLSIGVLVIFIAITYIFKPKQKYIQ